MLSGGERALSCYSFMISIVPPIASSVIPATMVAIPAHCGSDSFDWNIMARAIWHMRKDPPVAIRNIIL